MRAILAVHGVLAVHSMLARSTVLATHFVESESHSSVKSQLQLRDFSWIETIAAGIGLLSMSALGDRSFRAAGYWRCRQAY